MSTGEINGVVVACVDLLRRESGNELAGHIGVVDECLLYRVAEVGPVHRGSAAGDRQQVDVIPAVGEHAPRVRYLWQVGTGGLVRVAQLGKARQCDETLRVRV